MVRDIEKIHQGSGQAYGSPRVYRILKAMGYRVGKRTLERIIRDYGLKARKRRKYRVTTDSNHSQTILRLISTDGEKTAWRKGLSNSDLVQEREEVDRYGDDVLRSKCKEYILSYPADMFRIQAKLEGLYVLLERS